MAVGATTIKAAAVWLVLSVAVANADSSHPTAMSFLQVESRTKLKSSSNSVTGIINGSLVENASAKYPFFALPTASDVANDDTWLGCGASIISPTWGMTAQHCFGGGNKPCSGPKNLALWIGDLHLGTDSVISGQNGTGKQSVRIEAEVVCHPDFDGKCSHGNDIVLLRLKQALPAWVKPVPLALGGVGSVEAGHVTTNMGFGLREFPQDPQVISMDNPPELREVKLTIFDDDYAGCKKVYDGGYGCSDHASEAPAANKSQQLCAGATDEPQRDTCSGDSGSPMLDGDGIQIGIVSYGGGPGQKVTGDGRICADPKYMGVYTRVSAFETFIKSYVKDLPIVVPAASTLKSDAGVKINVTISA